jgi:hypothetical protein
VLIAENSYLGDQAFAAKLARLEADLLGDGWHVRRHDVSRNDSVTSVKALIKADYDADPANVKAAFLFGHVPVPYSGLLAPDGHLDHEGAWPADVYYGDMDGDWSDVLIDFANPGQHARSNTLGDGKYDPVFLPSDVELMVGRVDLANMPAFPLGEKELLMQYLEKDHNYRYKLLTAEMRGLIDDNFGDYAGAEYAVNGWRNFGPLVGGANTSELDWFGTLASQTYTWAYGCGPGWGTSACGIGCTAGSELSPNPWCAPDCANNNFVDKDCKAAFTMLFGSYFGDWDTQDNFMRAPLCCPTLGLSCCWAGEPAWFYHHMALGETLGFSTRLSQNNDGSLYVSPFTINSARQIHVALMGDPTLRLHVVAPPSNLTLNRLNETSPVNLGWTPSVEPVLGYNVYRSPSPRGPFILLNSEGPLQGTSFQAPAHTDHSYMVRAVKIENYSLSGSYSNVSQGVIATLPGPVAPVILTQPTSQNITAGANPAPPATQRLSAVRTAAFTVDAYGTDASGAVNLNFQWIKNGNTIAGATGPAYALNNVGDDAAGSYAVVISNPSGTITSTPATLFIHHAPAIQDDVYTISEGTTATFDVFSNDSGENPLTLLGLRSSLEPVPGTTSASPGAGLLLLSSGQGTVQYTPRPGFYGDDSFDYLVTDGQADALGTVSVHVNDTSLAHNLSQFGLAGTDISFTSGASRVLADGRWELSSGGGDPNSDAGHFESESRTGDFFVVARINALEGIEGFGTAGVMIRDGLGNGASYAYIGASDSDTYLYGFRESYRYGVRESGNGPEAFADVSSPAVSFPDAWVGLRRQGNQITRFISTNGADWTQVADQIALTSLPPTVKVGLFFAADGSSPRTIITDYQVRPILEAWQFVNGKFHFQISGGPSTGAAAIEGSTSLTPGTWTSLGTVSFSSGSAVFEDPLAINPSYPYYRFYRAKVGSIRSGNAIGFVEIAAAPGYMLIANQLNNGGNTPVEIFAATAVPNNTSVLKYDPVYSYYAEAAFIDSAWEGDPMTIAPGEGVWFHNPSSSAVTINFAGEIPQGILVSAVPSGWSIASSAVPQTGPLDALLGYVPTEGDAIELYNPASQSYSIFDYVDGAWEGDGGGLAPVPKVGESFEVNSSTSKSWFRSFSVWP